jgi:hypothetical protein
MIGERGRMIERERDVKNRVLRLTCHEALSVFRD